MPTATRRATSTLRASQSNRFGGARRYALGKLSGKASLDQNLAQLGIVLPAEDRAASVLQRIVELGDRATSHPDDLPYIIADVQKTPTTSS
ncbi:MAG: hypothetical protein R3F21_23480 [Myxococcota bacterium]